MSHIFISYSKKDIEFARHMRGLLQDKGFAVWMEETKLVPSEQWWSRIEQNIISCSAFIVIMSPDSKKSRWVEREILVAEQEEYRIQIFPVLFRGKAWSRLADIQYEDMRAGMNAVLSSEFVDGLQKYVPRFKGQTVPPQLSDEMMTSQTIRTKPDKPRVIGRVIWIIGILAIVAAMIAAAIGLIGSRQAAQTPIPTQTPPPAVVLDVTDKVEPAITETIIVAVPTSIETSTPSFTPEPSETSTETPMLTPEPSETSTDIPMETEISESDIEQTLQKEISILQTETAEVWTNTPTPDLRATALVWLAATQIALELTSTADAAISQVINPNGATPTFTPTFTPSRVIVLNDPTLTFTPTFTPSRAGVPNGATATFTVTAAGSNGATPTFTVTSAGSNSATATFTPSYTPGHASSASLTPSPLPPTFTVSPSPDQTIGLVASPTPIQPVTANNRWTPVIQNFDGVEMVLVPPGCFMMGSEEGDSDERPVHEVCFDEPFWIDRYEVSNSQFGSSGRWTENDQPRESISWLAAKHHCESRDARLPTEAEWEYAARGPSNLTRPENSSFSSAGGITFSGNFPGETTLVNTCWGCDSWIGAFHMLGNVSEWVNTIYDQDRFPYPYIVDDGREDPNVRDEARVLRGGSWGDLFGLMRASNRFEDMATNATPYYGFRCAHSYNVTQ